jgi:hypothetical protein
VGSVFFLAMSERYGDLEPSIAANALVGAFMQAFAAVELSVNYCIEEALELSFEQTTIVCANLTFRSKLHILNSINERRICEELEKSSASKLLDSVASLSTERNMVAHSPFLHKKTKAGKTAVEFLRNQASGRLKTDSIVWTIGNFEERLKKSERFHGGLLGFRDELKSFRTKSPDFSFSSLLADLVSQE